MPVITLERKVVVNSTVPVENIYNAIYNGEAQTHKFVITGTVDGVETAFTGTVSAKFLRADNTTVVMAGSLEDGKAVVTLGDPCYEVPGRFRLAIFVTNSNVTTCVYAAIGICARTSSSTEVDGSEIIPSIADLIQEIEDAVASIPADYSTLSAGVVRHDIAQTLTDAQKTQARANIGAVIDSTLTTAGAVADAKATGDEISAVKSAIVANQVEIKNNLSLLGLVYGVNRCNPSEIVSGMGMDADGIEYNSATYSHTGYIPVEPGDVIRLYSNYNIGEGANLRTIYAVTAFDANKTAVPASGGLVSATSWTVPAGIYFIIITQQSSQIVDRIPVVTVNEEISTIIAYVAPVYMATPGFEAETIDNTLSKTGFSADAKTTGDRIEAIANNFSAEKQKSDYIAKIYPIAGTKISADAVLSQAGEIVHCGKNLFDQSQFLKNPSITFDGEWYYGSGGQFNTVLSQLVFPPFKPHTTYILSYTVKATTANMYWKAGFSSDDGRNRYAANSSTTAERKVIISTPDAYIAKGNPANITGIVFTFSNTGYIYIKDVQLIEADYDDGTYEAYNGESVEVSSPYHAEFTAFDGENNVYSPGGTVTVEYYAQRKSHRENAVVVCMGDSITGNYPSATVPDSYPDLITETTGMNVWNCGFGGCRMSLHVEEPKAPFSFCSIVDSIVSDDWTSQDTQAMNELNHVDHVFAHIQNLKSIDWTKVEYITLFYGTNDWTGQVTLDNPDNSKDTSTYLGSFRYGYEKLMGAYPNIKFIVITPMYRFVTDDPAWDTETKQFNGKYIYDFGDALIEVCKGYHIPYIDMYRESGVNAYNRTNYIGDGTHPTEAGIINLANIIGGKVMAN